jgi:hypothetical protein
MLETNERWESVAPLAVGLKRRARLNLTFRVIVPLFGEFRLIHSAETSTTTVDRFVSRIHNLGLHKVLK